MNWLTDAVDARLLRVKGDVNRNCREPESSLSTAVVCDAFRLIHHSSCLPSSVILFISSCEFIMTKQVTTGLNKVHDDAKKVYSNLLGCASSLIVLC